MNVLRSCLRSLSPLAVSLAGFAGGAVFFAAVRDNAAATTPGSLLCSGTAGALAWLGLWTLLAFVLAPRLAVSVNDFMRRSGVWLALGLLPLILYLPYLAYRSGLSGVSVELPPLDSRPAAIILLAWSLLLMAVLLRLGFGKEQSRFVSWLERHPGKLLTTMIIAWIAVFFPLDVLKDHFMHVTTVNSALFLESLHNLNDERGFMFSNLLFDAGASVLAVHANFILLFFLPLFYIWPDYKLFLLVSDAALALAAVPLYLIARRRFSVAISLLLCAMYLLHPILTAQPGRSDFSELRFMPLLFLTAFYLFEKERFWLFALTTLLLMTIREDMGLFVAFFGVYALLCRRSLKWVLGPVIWGLAWFAVMYKLLLPGLSPTDNSARAAIRYAGGAGELIVRPFSTPSHLGVVYGLFITFGLGLPLLSLALVLALPALAEILLQKKTTLVNFMSLTAVPVLMVAMILGLKNFAGLLEKRWQLAAGRVTVFTAVIIFFVSVSAFHTWFNPGLYAPRYNYNAAAAALAMIPDDASVMLPEFTLIHSRPDQKVRGYHQIEYQKEITGDFTITEDYVLVDRRHPAGAGNLRYYRGLESVAEFMATSPDFEKVFDDTDLQLYVRVNGS